MPDMQSPICTYVATSNLRPQCNDAYHYHHLECLQNALNAEPTAGEAHCGICQRELTIADLMDTTTPTAASEIAERQAIVNNSFIPTIRRQNSDVTNAMWTHFSMLRAGYKKFVLC